MDYVLQPVTTAPQKTSHVSTPAPRAGHLSGRILKWSLLIALGPMLLLAAQGYHCAREAVLETAVERLTQLAASRKARLEEWLAERLADANFLANCPQIRSGLGSMAAAGSRGEHSESTAEFLGVFVTKFGIYEAIGVYDTAWRELASVGASSHGLADFSLSGIQEYVQQSKEAAVGRIHRHPNHRLGIHFGAQVFGAGQESTGYVLTALDYAQAMRRILHEGGGPGSQLRCYLVASDGLVLTEPNGRDGDTALALRIATEGFNHGIAGRTGASVYGDYLGREVVGGFAPIAEMGWVVLVEQDAADALSWLSRLAWRAGATALLVTIGVVLLSFRAARRMAAPLQQLAAVAYRVAEGVHETRVAPVAEPEVDAVGRALNHMLDQVVTARERLVHNATLAALGVMSSAVVHEMRNPLSSIKLNLRALRPQLGGDERHSELARIAEEQVERLERMLSDLLALGKPLIMNVRLMELRGAVAQAMEAVADDARLKRCRLRFQDEAYGATVRLDPERIQQALLNLLQNAIEAIDEGGEVVIRTSLDSPKVNHVLLEVLDNGHGIPEDNIERLFLPFFTTRTDGTGLGLAIVRKIVEYHGGRVSAANRTGSGGVTCGAVFRIELPHEAAPELVGA